MKADDIPSECIEEPRFIKVLAASLCSEIAETKVALDETNGKIQKLKGSVVEGWEKRKKLKRSIEEMSQQKHVLNAALNSLVRETRNRSIEIEIVKNHLDDGTLCEIGKRVRFEKIIEDYRNTWKRYKDEYEKQPLATKRQRCRVDVKRATVQLMMAEYKKKEFNKMIKQREKNFSLQIKAAIVDFSKTILERWKDDKYLEKLESIAAELEEEFNGYTLQLAEVQREIESKRLAEFEDAAKMPPPRLHFPFMCSIIYPNADEKAMSRHQRSKNPLTDDIGDTTSVNTLMLEEMCAEDDYEMNENPVDSMARGLAPESKNSNFRSMDNSRCWNEKRKSKPTIIDQSTDKIREKIQSLEIAKENIERCDQECVERANLVKKNEEANSNVQKNIDRESPGQDFESQSKRVKLVNVNEKLGNPEIRIVSKNNKKGNTIEGNSVRILQPEVRPIPIVEPLVMAEEDKSEIPLAQRRGTLAGSTNDSSICRKRYESAQSMTDREIDDSSFRDTPKIRRIDNADYSSEFLKCAQERPPRSDAQTPGQHPLSSPLSRSYLPSCVSSDNLSNIPDWPKISRVGAVADFASFRNWDNWSPNRELSVMSFSPSSFVSTSKNHDSPEKRGKIGGQRNSIPQGKADDDSQTFFKTTTQKSKGSFL